MSLNTLVLNADYRPVSCYPLSTWSFERTMKNVLKNRVSVLETYDVELRSQNLTYRPPSVVALVSYVKRPARVPFTRLNLMIRDEFTCQYCGQKFEAKDLTFDHVVPRAAGGKSGWLNAALACTGCNSLKGHRVDIKPMRPPREPKPSEMLKLKHEQVRELHQSWMDYLYWSGALERD